MSIGLLKYVGMGLAVLALVAVIVLGVRGCRQDDRNATNQSINQGAAIERGAASSEVINRVQNADDAVRSPSDAERNVVCSRYDRNCPNGK